MADLRKFIQKRRRRLTTRNLCRPTQDRISNLPDEILQRILSLLPTVQAIRTTILSKQWHGLWERLSLQEQSFQIPTTKRFHEHAAPIMYPQGAGLFLSNVCLDLFNDHVDTKEHIRKVFLVDVIAANDKSLERTISSFPQIEDLDLSFPDGLKLGGCHWRQGWPSMAISVTLKKLTLQVPNMSNNWFQSQILEKFPLLEDLTVRRCFSLTNVNISSKTIKKLCLDQCHSLHEINIDTPVLEDFKFASRKVVSFDSTKFINANWEFLRVTIHLCVKDHRQALRLLQLTADFVNMSSQSFEVHVDCGSIRLPKHKYCALLSVLVTNNFYRQGVTIPEKLKGNFLPPLVSAKRLTVDATVTKSCLTEFLTPKLHCFPCYSLSSEDQLFIKKLQEKTKGKQFYHCREVAHSFDDIIGFSSSR